MGAKMQVWVYYLCIQHNLVSHINIHWPGEKYYSYPGYGPPDEVKGQLHYRYYHRQTRILTFAEFCNDNQHGIGYYWIRFYDKINLLPITVN